MVKRSKEKSPETRTFRGLSAPCKTLLFAVQTAVLRGGDLEFPAEVTTEHRGIGEASFRHNLANSEVGGDKQLAGIFQTQVADKLRQ